METSKSVWTNAFLIIPSTLIFFFAGTVLFAFYKKNYPAELNPTFENNDAIFPWYIASQLPAGISGLLKGEWKGISGKAPRIMVFAIINISSTKTGGFPNEKNN